MACPGRLYALRKPLGHRPPVPRWTLKFPDTVTDVYTAYVGGQWHGPAENRAVGIEAVTSELETWQSSLPSQSRPLWSERFTCERGQDEPGSIVHVHYWNSRSAYTTATSSLNLASRHAALPAHLRPHVGLWAEHFATPLDRLETNYSGPDYVPGVGRTPGTSTREHTLSAYWGAARDRIHDSAHDQFEKKESQTGARESPSPAPRGLGQHICGTVGFDNLVHIRSGQYWEECEDEEREAYEEKLEPTLLAGLGYLWENAGENGVVGLRYLRNHDNGHGAGRGSPRRETCGAGFFRNLAELENWAEKHISHKKIFAGAIGHANRFGPDKRFRTWHEVSVLKQGEAQFAYVNCSAGTGAIPWLQLGYVKEL